MNRLHGQSAIEYVVLIIAAAVALTVFFGFIRNAMSHRYKTGADGVGHGMRY